MKWLAISFTISSNILLPKYATPPSYELLDLISLYCFQNKAIAEQRGIISNGVKGWGFCSLLWKKSLNNSDDDSPEKTDERVEQAEEEEADDDKESVRLDASEEITDPCRRETHENF